MTKFKELSKQDLNCIVDYVNVIFGAYHIDAESVKAFWECVEIGNKKFAGA